MMFQDEHNREYVLITPAYNEEAYLEKTIQSVIAQTHLPQKWVIVSDGSTDRTDEIATDYAEKYQFIEFIRHEDELKPEFGIAARKVSAIQAGFKHLDAIPYMYYGNLDADISFTGDFYSSLINKFESNPKLGIGGSYVYNTDNGQLSPYSDNPVTVAGPIQFFRRQCWDDIGGYYPGAYEDSIAIVMARMKGWDVQSFPDIRAYHHKCAGLPGRNQLRAKFHVGRMEHIMGDHFLYEVVRCAGYLPKKPLIIGGLLRLLGYSWSALKGNAIQTPADVVKYMRNAQVQRLKNILRLGSKRLK
jgi:glycosyltransferase involved in cell wall biosynthesis